jgi:hypothetical protein
VLDVKSIKFAERVQKKKFNKNGAEVNDSFDCKLSLIQIVSNQRTDATEAKPHSKSSISKQREFKIRSHSKKGRSVLKNLRREAAMTKSSKYEKRPSTKEAIDRNSSISQASEGIESMSCQFNTAYHIKTPVNQSSKYSEGGSDPTYGLSKTNESFKNNIKWVSGSKAQNSTVGFSSSTDNTTKYNREFNESGFQASKNAPSGNQSTITRSSFYK